MPRLLSTLTPIALLLACGSDKDTSNDVFDPETFEGGSFQIQTVGVSDGCLSGDFDSVFQPNGPGNPITWSRPVVLPSWSVLPQSYAISLVHPLGESTVTFEDRGDGQMGISGAEALHVEIDAESYPACSVEVSVQGAWAFPDGDTLDGALTLSLAAPTPDTCPALRADPCEIDLPLVGSRLPQ